MSKVTRLCADTMSRVSAEYDLSIIVGMDNEAIVSTFIYVSISCEHGLLEHTLIKSSFQYYDTENISESTLSFRNAVNEPRYHFQSDEYCMKHLYNIGQYVPTTEIP